jgi:uncharacterized protein (DUF1810 family)
MPGSKHDPFNLNRFVDAQHAEYESIVKQLERGVKTGHWMWFVFPQLKGLGRSALSQRFAISSLDEAKAYTRHSTLGPRLRECTSLTLATKASSIEDVFEFPDNLKFQSSMTLFVNAAPDVEVFSSAITTFFGGALDQATLSLLKRMGPS